MVSRIAELSRIDSFAVQDEAQASAGAGAGAGAPSINAPQAWDGERGDLGGRVRWRCGFPGIRPAATSAPSISTTVTITGPPGR
ncbi:hypothetical protein QR64_20120 [Rhodococcus sp. Chr-9]|nr:hypothetical protein QR64_20120 [Rhodococcus sp. Chr-9]